MLWNQLKSNALGIPVKVLEEADTTVLGRLCTDGGASGKRPALRLLAIGSTIVTVISILRSNLVLKTISPLISPELLKTLAEMGHGDEIILQMLTFPQTALGQRRSAQMACSSAICWPR